MGQKWGEKAGEANPSRPLRFPLFFPFSVFCSAPHHSTALLETVAAQGLRDAAFCRFPPNTEGAQKKQMVVAPPLVANGLSGDYRLLAEFDNIVLAGHEREGGYGVEFITWERIQNGARLWQGHYYDNDYAAAKQDFATRSGLLPSELLFTQDQLAVIFDAAQHMTALGLVSNPAQEKLLEQIMEQIEDTVPQVIDLANELTESPKQHEAEGMQLN